MRKTHPLEIAVVVVCVLVAAWVFVPRWWFGYGGEQNPKYACLNNVKQLGLALKQYSYDFGEAYPWRAGAADPDEAWLDLGMLFPNYISGFRCYFCRSAADRPFEPMCALGPKMDHPLEPLFCTTSTEATSYAYCFDASDPQNPTAWTENAHATVRLLTDKKAGTRIGSLDNPVGMANHRDEGRNVLYHDGHVKWETGTSALDPDEDQAAIGDPKAKEYRAWWSDPPYYGE